MSAVFVVCTLLVVAIACYAAGRRDERAIQEVKHLRVIDALERCWVYLDGRADASAEGDPSEFMPNEEMRLLGDVGEALGIGRR